MKYSIFISLILTIILISCKKENKQSNQEDINKQEVQIDTTSLVKQETEPIIKVGQLLVAKPTIEDPIFSKSIILITLIKKGKVYGLILNKDTDEKLSDYIENVKQKDITIGYGGPVKEDLVFIQTFDSISKNSREVMKGLYFMGDVVTIKDKLQRSLTSKSEINFFKGMVVWNIEQLDKELNEWKDWKVIDLSVSEIMSINQNSWEKLNK